MTLIRTASNTSRTLLFSLTIVAAAAVAQDLRGETRIYTLDPSNHGNPEGIAYDESTAAFFVGTIGDGTIYRGTLGNLTVTPFIPGPGHGVGGMKVARGKLYVAGGFSGRVLIYDIGAKQQVAAFQTSGGFLNDLVVTPDGDVFVTDSFAPILWRITAAQVAAGGGVPAGIPVGPEIVYNPNDFNLNGIVALKGGRSLIVVQTYNGKLFRIDLDERAPLDREIHPIDVESLLGGDGLRIDGNDLLVVQGFPSASLTFVRLDGNWRRVW